MDINESYIVSITVTMTDSSGYKVTSTRCEAVDAATADIARTMIESELNWNESINGVY